MKRKLYDEELNDVHLAIFFKDFAAWIRSSCVGLNVAGFTTAKYLKEHGINTTVFPVRHNVDIVRSIDKYNETHTSKLTHVVISAPWLSIYDIECLVKNFSDIQFVILSHSNVGFLQADPYGVRLLRKYAELSKTYKNLRVGGNSLRFVEWFKISYNEDCVCLPNLYPTPKIKSKMWSGNSPIKIGIFGAIRPEKNFMTAAASAIAIRSILKIPIEIHMSTGGENCKSTTLQSITEMTENIEGVSLICHNWETWDKFIQLIKQMDLMFQLSYSESFNMITADGIFCGVPSVVSPVIYWAPDSWKTDIDDTLKAAKVGIKLLTTDQKYVGSDSLMFHNVKSLKYWVEFLKKK